MAISIDLHIHKEDEIKFEHFKDTQLSFYQIRIGEANIYFNNKAEVRRFLDTIEEGL